MSTTRFTRLSPEVAAQALTGFVRAEPKVATFGTRTELMAKVGAVPIAMIAEERVFFHAFVSKLASSKKDAYEIYQSWQFAKMLCLESYRYTAESLSGVDNHFDAMVKAIAPANVAEEAIVLKNEVEQQTRK